MSEPEDGAGQDAARPSFADFWKRNKKAHQSREVTFVLSGMETGTNEEDPANNTASQRHSQARRAQVRKAQIQHRQRKANYAKELEVDTARLRDMIEETETESRALKAENDTIRKEISRNAVASGAMNLGVPKIVERSLGPDRFRNAIPPSTAVEKIRMPVTGWQEPQPQPEYTLRMDMSEPMQTPAFHVSRTPIGSGGSGSGSQRLEVSTGSGSGARTQALDSALAPQTLTEGLTQEQTDLVINFILALEHICWNHFDHSYYTHTIPNPSDTENGHALMASSIALQHAPLPIFARIDAVQIQLHTDPTCRPHTTDIEWRSAGLTLDSLFALASTLNPPDQELAPVQAWFEIARIWGPDVALDRQVIESLKGEFAGVVKCLHFGAVIEREAFDSIVGRVVAARWVEMGMWTDMNMAGLEDG
ncbi:hypothetical protein BJ170DRAFT_13297 [Xylariales sp. AK1849]|nr:hypothetical protein BJ170DRAFT_13297 [Xylariales sp. AK1849]